MFTEIGKFILGSFLGLFVPISLAWAQYVHPSLPMFLLMPFLLRKGISFPAALSAGVALTGVLYFLMTKVFAKFCREPSGKCSAQ